MRQLTRVLRFAREPLQRVDFADERWAHDLDRALPLHAHALGQIDLSHSAFADARLDTIARRDDGTNQVADLATTHEP